MNESGFDLWRRKQIYVLQWNRFDELAIGLADRLGDVRLDGVVAIAKGGLVPGVRLAHLLNVPYVGSLSIVRNAGDDPFPQRVLPTLSSVHIDIAAGSSLLVVDDIVGSGDTLKLALAALRERDFSSVTTVSIAFNSNGRYAPDFYGIAVDDWLVFPWERHPAVGSRPDVVTVSV